MKPIGISPSRRNFLRKTITIAPAAAAAVTTGAAGSLAHAATANKDQGPYQPTYFNADEFATLSALVDRLIPADEQGPGAVQAGVAEFIDKQMDTPYGHGQLWYMHGPFVEDASPKFGYQLHYPPRDLYRTALAGIQSAVQKQYGKKTAELDADTRDTLLHQLEDGKVNIGEAPAAGFFALLLQNTHEGYFSDPVYGGNKNMDAWRMINFPGARADYMDWVEQYGKAYPLPPVSIG